MPVTVKLNKTTEARHRLDGPHRHFDDRSRAEQLLALTRLLAFVRGAQANGTQRSLKRTTTAGEA